MICRREENLLINDGRQRGGVANMGRERSADTVRTASLLVPTLNEARHIRKCLDSLVAQDYEREAIEVVVIDGGSTDDTRDIVRGYTQRFAGIRLLRNPKQRQSAAYNIGIAETRGEFVLVIVAHATYERGYVRKCIDLLEQSGAQNVGGAQFAESTSYLGTAIAMATCSRFGVGDATFRYVKTATVVESVFGGTWRRTTLEGIGGFNEDLPVSEDYELNYRIREHGGKIISSPDIRIKYFCRDSIRAVAKQYFRYGYWKFCMIVLHPRSIRWRNLVPPAFVIVLLASALIAHKYPREALVTPSVYLLANLIVSAVIAVKRDVKCVFLLPLVYLVLHVSWGSGFLCCALRKGFQHVRTEAGTRVIYL
jgi:succinoglycan biosynthesis protein ExoA